MTKACVFCDIATVPVALADARPGDVVRVWEDALALVPLGPVVEGGHLLVIPRAHVADVAEGPAVSATAMARAAQLLADLGWEANVVTSRGRVATQTVFHLHLHIVRRTAGDTVSLPWDVRTNP